MKTINRTKLIYQRTKDPEHVLRVLDQIEQMPDLGQSDESLCSDVWATICENDKSVQWGLLAPLYLVNLGRLLERGEIHAGETDGADLQ